MNERKRQAYLEAMDIQTYFPRQQLSGAKPSPVYDFSVVDSAPADLDEPAPSQQTNTAPARKGESKVNGLAAIEELRSRPSASPKATVTPIRQSIESPKPVLPKTETETGADLQQENSLRFTLRYYRINEKLAVLDEVPLQGSRQLNEESLSLMQAILKALGQEDLETQPKAEEFSWPVQSDDSMKGAPEVEAAKAISGFLQMRKETDGFTNLLVFAGQLEDILLQFNENKATRDFESSKGYFITVSHSLASMLAVPSLKRDVWQHLQPLRKRISS